METYLFSIIKLRRCIEKRLILVQMVSFYDSCFIQRPDYREDPCFSLVLSKDPQTTNFPLTTCSHMRLLMNDKSWPYLGNRQEKIGLKC